VFLLEKTQEKCSFKKLIEANLNSYHQSKDNKVKSIMNKMAK
jgi:hypothetical protein